MLNRLPIPTNRIGSLDSDVDIDRQRRQRSVFVERTTATQPIDIVSVFDIIFGIVIGLHSSFHVADAHHRRSSAVMRNKRDSHKTVLKQRQIHHSCLYVIHQRGVAGIAPIAVAKAKHVAQHVIDIVVCCRCLLLFVFETGPILL
jgi:hypothetical protein